MLGISNEGRWFVAGILLGCLVGWLLAALHFRRRRRTIDERPPPALTERRGQVADRRRLEGASRTGPHLATAQSPASPRTWIPAQDLSAIRGVGPIFEQKLYNAGIGTYSQLAALSDAEVRAIVQPKPWQAFHHESWNDQARRLAEETGTTGALWNGLIPDDLSRIKGIGEAYEQTLYEAGILTFADLAAMNVQELQSIVQREASQEMDLGDWIARARELADEVDLPPSNHDADERSSS